MKIIKYMVISESWRYDLENKVNEFTIKGWQPIGGVSVITFGFGEKWSQAMVKYGE